MDKEKAEKLLMQAGLFYYEDEKELAEDEDMEGFKNTLNMNDVWGWACSDCEKVPDDQLEEVGKLFFNYGWCGVLYWVSQQHNGMKSEFLDNNRFIEFVKSEEELTKRVPNSSQRAYRNIKYRLGESHIKTWFRRKKNKLKWKWIALRRKFKG